MLTLILFTIFLLISLILFVNVYRHFTFWQRQGLPCLPFVATSWASIPMHQFMDEQSVKYGKIYGIYKGSVKNLIVNDAKLARELSTKEFHKFPVRNSFYKGTTNINHALFLMEANEDWKRIRAIVTPAFTTGKLKRMISPIERIANNFIENIRPFAQTKEEFDLKKYIGGFAMDVIACCGYGIELDSVREPNHPVVVNAKKILNVDATPSMILANLWPSMAKLLRLEPFDKDAVKYFDDLTFQIVEKRMKALDVKQNSDLLGLMIENAGGIDQQNLKLKTISKDEISGQGILFFIAGFDTTHATFDHVIYYLSMYPEWQEKLYQELVQFKDELDYEKIKELPLLNAIISETLRLKPPLIVIHREAKKDCTLLDTGIMIPKKTIISIQTYIIHHDPEYFPDPLAFKPERFLLIDKSRSAESNFAYMPFGVGPRLCVGMRFAQNELRIGLANFFLNYKVTIDPGFKLEYFKGSVLLSPKNLFVQISER